MMKQLYTIIFLISILLISCELKQVKFEEKKWKLRNDIDYNYREFMIKDLKENYLKPGIKYKEVGKLLGENYNERSEDSIQLQYEIYTDFGTDIDPVETKTFIVNFNSDSIFVNTRIDHWSK
ncbi:hypothetical protein ACEN2I_05685 [Flavobacterium sp. W22_SRS_FK3]|uniref:hypothetical protein n=1 Tax=Flavobacterium sp. W22_SRS_FK3 TaxID=3240275 RepID=UPI003F8F58CB